MITLEEKFNKELKILAYAKKNNCSRAMARFVLGWQDFKNKQEINKDERK